MAKKVIFQGKGYSNILRQIVAVLNEFYSGKLPQLWQFLSLSLEHHRLQ